MFLRNKAKAFFNGTLSATKSAYTLAKVVIGSTLLSTANAGVVCFEKNDHDHKLVTRGFLSSDNILSTLINKCGAYTTGGDDCARWFTLTREYGRGFFGGTSCTLDYHLQNSLDSCIDQTLKEQCTNGYGTFQDVMATLGIAIGGLVVIGTTIYCIAKCHQSASPELNLQQGLLSGRTSPALFGSTSDRKDSADTTKEDEYREIPSPA